MAKTKLIDALIGDEANAGVGLGMKRRKTLLFASCMFTIFGIIPC